MLAVYRFHMCTSLIPTMMFGLETRLCVLMHTKPENVVLCNGEQLGGAINSFVNQCEFEAIKKLSGRKAPCCDKHLMVNDGEYYTGLRSLNKAGDEADLAGS